jgi:hypothetical protein
VSAADLVRGSNHVILEAADDAPELGGDHVLVVP